MTRHQLLLYCDLHYVFWSLLTWWITKNSIIMKAKNGWQQSWDCEDNWAQKKILATWSILFIVFIITLKDSSLSQLVTALLPLINNFILYIYFPISITFHLKGCFLSPLIHFSILIEVSLISFDHLNHMQCALINWEN